MKEKWSPTLFIDDITEKDMLHACVIRSASAAGEIVDIHIPEEVRKQFILVTASDIPAKKTVSFFNDTIPVLAEKEVRYQGEPILILAGTEEEEVLEAAREIHIEYQETSQSAEKSEEEHLVFEKKSATGKPDAAFKAAARIVEGNYRTGIQRPGYSDPQGAVVKPGKKTVTVHSSTQWPFHVRDSVAQSLGRDAVSVVVSVPGVSPHLDGKIWFPSLVAVHAAVTAVKANKPVRLIIPREDDFFYGPRRAPVFIQHKTGLDEEGNITVMDIQVILDVGAYPVLAEEMLDRIINSISGPYATKALRIHGKIITSNNPPAGTFTGFGLNQCFFALETHANRLAEVGGNGPIEWRFANFRKKGISADQLVPIIADVASRSDFDRKFAAYKMLKKQKEDNVEERESLRGIGFSLGYQLSGLLHQEDEATAYSIVLRLDDNEKLHLLTSAIPGSKGTREFWKEIAGSILGIDTENVIVEAINSSLVPDSGPSILSHNVSVIPRLIERACQGIQKRRFRSPLPIEVKRTIKPAGSESGHPSSWGGAVVELDVHPHSYEVGLRGIWITIDCGRVINRESAVATIESGVLHSLEWLGAGLSGLPVVPRIFIEFVDSGKKNPPAGIGELAASMIPAAYSSALSQAAGYYIDSIPLQPEKIFGYKEG